MTAITVAAIFQLLDVDPKEQRFRNVLSSSDTYNFSPETVVLGCSYTDIGTPPVVGVCDITSFAPEPYTLTRPLRASIAKHAADSFVASQYELNIHASGDTESEAVENLKKNILDTFDTISAEPRGNLGPRAIRQFTLLSELIARA